MTGFIFALVLVYLFSVLTDYSSDKVWNTVYRTAGEYFKAPWYDLRSSLTVLWDAWVK